MSQLAIQPIFEQATRLHQAGQLQEAEQFYRRILAQQPQHVGALHHLGILANQVGQRDAAIDLIRRAIALVPNNPKAYCNLGIVLNDTGQFDDAIAAHRQAISLNPNFAAAHSNLGNVLKNKGLLDEAIAAQRRAIALDADFPEAYSNLGNALVEKGQLDEAIAALRKAIALNPKYPDALNNLGNALRNKGQLDESLAALRQAVALNPNIAEAHYNLGLVLKDKTQFDAAAASFRQAIALKPNYPEAHTNLGMVLKDTGRLDDAIAAFRRGIALRPNSSALHTNLMFTVQYHPAYDPATILAELSQWDRQFAAPLRNTLPPHQNDRSPDRRLKIGYVSPDFKFHIQSLLTLPLFRHHRHELFEIFMYSSVLRPDNFTPKIRQHADVWRHVAGQSDEQVAESIRKDRIDILVDLTMHMADGRPLVFARKPAPIQIAWLAYPGTTGLKAMDYRLTDPYLDPPGEHDSWYAEKSIRLPHTFWCYHPATDQPKVNALPALQSGQITFGCLNNFCKVTSPTLSLWSAVLKSIPRSRLILLSPQGEHRRRVLGQLDVDPERVEFVEFQPRTDFLKTHHRIDLCLDTFPYNGHTTSLDSLWMGVPVISLCGNTVVSRAGFSQSSNLGLADQFVAHTAEDFVRLAVGITGDLPRLAELRSSLRQRMEQSPLMDGRQFAENVESVYRQVWREACKTDWTHR